MIKRLSFRKVFVLSILLVSFISFITAQSHDDFSEAKNIIDKNIACSNLTLEEIEMIGDYYMEQIHPGEAHEVMDEMMGGEGSVSLSQMHINMAYRFYCSKFDSSYANTYANNYGGMMGGGMMYTNTNAYPSMMDDYGYSRSGIGFIGWIFTILIIIILILVIILLLKKINGDGKKRKR